MSDSDNEVERRLAAILAADVAGYSRLMGEDEDATLKTLRAHREVMDSCIARHRGRIVGTAGDSVLAEFPSATEAVRCGVEVQRQLGLRNEGVPEDRRMQFRIGINLGEVMIEGDEIYGDGVNVAARLEAIAEPGGLCISSTVFEQVRDRVPHDFEDIGEHTVKNISRAVHAYRVPLEEGAAQVAGPESADSGRPAIAVLPSENMNKDSSQDYFVDGMTDDILTELSRVPDFAVIARNSSFAYKGQAVNVQNVAKELGARYVLEGGVRMAGNRVRINAQLIDAGTGHHLWAERYDREMDDIFAVQDEITQAITGALAGRIVAEEMARSRTRPTEIMAAYDYYLRALDLFLTFDPSKIPEAREMISRALELDPTYARAYTSLAWSHLQEVFLGYAEDPAVSLKNAFEMAQKALHHDPTDNWGHWVTGVCLLYSREYEKSFAAYSRALELRPNDADVLAQMGALLNYMGRGDEALALVKRGKRLNPHYPWWYDWMEAFAHIVRGDGAAAVAAAERTGRPIPAIDQVLILAWMLQGKTTEAQATAKELLARQPDFTISRWGPSQPYMKTADMEAATDMMRAAGIPE